MQQHVTSLKVIKKSQDPDKLAGTRIPSSTLFLTMYSKKKRIGADVGKFSFPAVEQLTLSVVASSMLAFLDLVMEMIAVPCAIRAPPFTHFVGSGVREN